MRNQLLASLAISAAMIVGCKDDKTTPAPPPASTPGEKVDAATQQAKDSANSAIDGAKDLGNKAVDDAAGVTDQAKKLFDDGMKALADNKIDVADSSLAGLEKIKPQLSPEWQGNVDKLKSAIETAKKANLTAPDGIRLPGT